jgi:amino acid adenylation domain-containing protein
MAFLLHHLLEESARRSPERVAVTAGTRSLTYGELDREADRFAAMLVDRGVTRGGLVGIHLKRGPDAIVALLGSLKAGAAYVPLDPQSPAPRLRFIVDTCSIQTVVGARDGFEILSDALRGAPSIRSVVAMDAGLASASVGLPVVEWLGYRGGMSPIPAVPTIDADPAYVLFTSGSTGTPKGVVLSHRNALTFVDAASEFFKIAENDRLSHVCPLQSDMSVFDIYVALKAGASIVIVPETASMFPLALARVIDEGRITVWNSVPSALASLGRLERLEPALLSSLRLVLFAGEVFPANPLRRLMAAAPGARFCNMYGQTEANSSTYHWIDEAPHDPRQVIPIGRALPNFDVFAIDDDGKQVCEAGGEGEFHVRASTVAMRYWGDPDRTAASFIANPLDPSSGDRAYRTGDIVRLNADGEYVFVGRRDTMVKSRGYRVEIDEIEGVLRGHPAIRNAAVIPIPDERIGNRLAAFVELLVPGSLTSDDVVSHCAGSLPRYMVPEAVSFRDALPLTTSGKIDRRRLSEP